MYYYLTPLLRILYVTGSRLGPDIRSPPCRHRTRHDRFLSYFFQFVIIVVVVVVVVVICGCWLPFYPCVQHSCWVSRFMSLETFYQFGKYFSLRPLDMLNSMWFIFRFVLEFFLVICIKCPNAETMCVQKSGWQSRISRKWTQRKPKLM
jgi:hypothetical protein